jgi:uncharacterized cupin superfamily protein
MRPVNEREVPTEETRRGNTHFRRTRLSDAAADDPEIGCSRYELPPGGRSWPYHYHTGNAEAMYVLSGSGTLRLGGEEHPIEAGDFVPLPAGEDGCHRVVNDSGAPLRYLMVSTMDEPDVTVYPDSGKVGVFAGSPPGGTDERSVEGYFRLDDRVDYWTDEE